MYHNFFDQKGVNKMAQRKFIIDGGFKTDDASELLANLTMGGSILPNVDSDGTTGYDLGSTTAKWRDLYLSQGSLYINNQKVIHDDSGTIVFKADMDQGLTVKTEGTGVITLQSTQTVNVAGTELFELLVCLVMRWIVMKSLPGNSSQAMRVIRASLPQGITLLPVEGLGLT